MEQRIYGGAVSANDLSAFLVAHFDPQEDVQAQKIGQAGTNLVQIGRGDEPKDLHHALTVAITERQDGAGGVSVTMGQQQWLTPKSATFAASMGLVGLLVTPFALFALLWPISEIIGSSTLPSDIWNIIDSFVISRGGTVESVEHLKHPHAL